MKLNKELLISALSQIKANGGIAVFRDSADEGCIDILYNPKFKGNISACVHKITVRASGGASDLFDDSPNEKLGRDMPVYINRLRSILKNPGACVLDNGIANGIQVEVKKSDFDYSINNIDYTVSIYDKYSKNIESVVNNGKSSFVLLRKEDYFYVVTECSKFVSTDETRYFMNGVCFDFERGEGKAVNIVATDGGKLILITKTARDSDLSGKGEFIILPEFMGNPASNYAQARINLSNEVCQILINTEDYRFESLFLPIEGQFPNYPKVMPEISDKTAWFTLRGDSLRKAVEPFKSMMKNDRAIYLNGENTE